MGLTVHYKLAAPKITTLDEARQLVLAARRVAVRFQREGWVQSVGEPMESRKLLNSLACEWLNIPVPGKPNRSIGLEIHPKAGSVFCVEVGEDCEPLWLGLCHYPARYLFEGRDWPTRLRGWRLHSFSKTQYASLHGEAHFLRCHRGVVELLAALRPLGFRVIISDEGGYWPHRSLSNVRREVAGLNCLVAAAAGGLRDLNAGNGAPVESPIFRHKDFERLEAEGSAKLTRAQKLIAEALMRAKLVRGEASDGSA